MKGTNVLFSIIIVLSALLGSSMASAYGSYHGSSSFGGDDQGWLVMPQGIYFFTTDSQGGTNTTVNRYVFDGSVGYKFQLLYLGAEYNYDQQVTTTTPNSVDTYKSYGAQIGIMTGGFQFLGTYFVGSSGTTAGGTGSETDYSGGTGFQILVGYLMDIGSGFSVGPEFLYRSLTYTSLSNGKALTSNYSFSTFIPQIGVKYMF